jgi:hypothetical protein
MAMDLPAHHLLTYIGERTCMTSEKIAIPDSILLKKGPLTADEW